METQKKNLFSRGVYISLFIFVVGASFFIKYFDKKEEDNAKIEQMLTEVSKRWSKELPMMVDEHTRCDRIIQGPNRTLTYNYTLVKIHKDDLNSEEFKSRMLPTLVNTYRNSEGMETFRKMGVTLHYIYHDKNGNFFTDITVGPNQT